MNLMPLDKDPQFAAMYLSDVYVRKLTLEVAQMMCDCLRVYGLDPPYKKYNLNHPHTKWVRETKGNYAWTLRYLRSLCNEHRIRYAKQHSVEYIGLLYWLENTSLPEALEKKIIHHDSAPASQEGLGPGRSDKHLQAVLYPGEGEKQRLDEQRRTRVVHARSDDKT